MLAALNIGGDQIIALTCLIVSIVAVAWCSSLLKARSAQRQQNESRLQQSSQLQQQREARAFQQNELINEIGVEKLRAEAHLLELQGKLAQFELGRREREEEQHRLIVEKVKLETEQLRLRNRQLRRELGDDHEFE